MVVPLSLLRKPSVAWPGPLLILLAMAALASLAAAEDTPPELVVETPVEGASLALTVVVSGTAVDAEGFNVSSYVEARWNEWEWWHLPSNPGDEGHSLYFGETVVLDWHAPGPHRLQVRAYDGEAYSGTVEVNVTVRDLPDLVVLPTDISLEPEDAIGGDEAEVVVLVRNQGGEAVEEVEVLIKVGGEQVGASVIPFIDPYGWGTARFELALEAGNLTVLVSTRPLGSVNEKSMANNQAERTFRVPGEEDGFVPWQSFLFMLATVGLFILLVLSALSVGRSGPPRKG